MFDETRSATANLLAPVSLHSYLAFGYVPQLRRPDPFAVIGGWDGDSPVTDSKVSDLAARGTEVLRAAARTLSATQAGKTHVILLSGGIDSRAALGALLEGVDAKNVEAWTYGWRGSDDYELAAKLCRLIGVRHHLLDIRAVEWSTETLLESGRDREFPPSFVVGARFFNHLIYSEYGADAVFWDGFLGDCLSGRHLPPEPAESWEDALAGFDSANLLKSPVSLAPPGFDFRSVLPSEPLCARDSMEFSDQLDIAVRQTCYIGNRIPLNRDTMTLFTHPSLARFLLRLPRSMREDQRLYKQMLVHAFAQLFAIDIQGGRAMREKRSLLRKLGIERIGKAKKSIVPNAMVGLEMRTKPSLRTVISENLADLEARKIIDWIDIRCLWDDHLGERAQHTNALRVLCSLEIALKLGEMAG